MKGEFHALEESLLSGAVLLKMNFRELFFKVASRRFGQLLLVIIGLSGIFGGGGGLRPYHGCGTYGDCAVSFSYVSPGNFLYDHLLCGILVDAPGTEAADAGGGHSSYGACRGSRPFCRGDGRQKWTESGKNMFDFMKKWGYNEGKRYFVRPMAGRESAQV